jgi:hypothetical protein
MEIAMAEKVWGVKIMDRAEFAGLEGPTAAYCEFLAAIARRDIDGTLVRMSEEYGRDLRAMRSEPNFSSFFDLWCGTYPESTKLISYTLGDNSAIFETEGFIEGLAFATRVVLNRVGTTWYVSSENFEA